MTSRQLYDGVLIELHKENAPNILLEDFNYFANKSINQYINKRYNIYDVSQQTTDDLRVLKATAMLTPQRMNLYDDLSLAHMATYYVDLPIDYLHILNCICIYKVKKTYKCYNQGDTWRASATRLTSDAYSQVLDNFWLKPSYKRPYYYIHNINLNEDGVTPNDGDLPTNPYSEHNQTGTDSTATIPRSAAAEATTPGGSTLTLEKDWIDGNDKPIALGIKLHQTINIGGTNVSNVERGQGLRYGNVSKVRMEIRYGTDDSVFSLGEGKVYIDYIKTPLHIRLTQEELDLTEDTSQVLEFPDYVCQEILNELVHIIMENISDLRLQTHPVVSLSIANPAQALAPEASGKNANT